MFEMSNALHHNASYKQSLSYACGCMCVGALPGTHVNMCANPVSPYFTTRNKKKIYIYIYVNQTQISAALDALHWSWRTANGMSKKLTHFSMLSSNVFTTNYTSYKLFMHTKVTLPLMTKMSTAPHL